MLTDREFQVKNRFDEIRNLLLHAENLLNQVRINSGVIAHEYEKKYEQQITLVQSKVALLHMDEPIKDN